MSTNGRNGAVGKIVVMPGVEASDDVKLRLMQQQLSSSRVFVVYVDNQGEWKLMHSACQPSEICLAGAFMQHAAMRGALNAKANEEPAEPTQGRQE